MKKTLYVTDLDGTLLNRDEQITDFTANTINELVSRGMIFSYATARSKYTAFKKTEKITAEIPVILYNGAFIIDSLTDEILSSKFFEPQEYAEILNALTQRGVSPIVYSFFENRERYSYIPGEITEEARHFLKTRENDERDTPVNSREELSRGNAFYFACIDSEEKLFPIYERFKNTYNCVYGKDIYSGDTWLEITSSTKAAAVLKLKALLNCHEIVCFGDGKNDIPMFLVADRCYAMENAAPELKSIATAVIKSNEQDGVANWLLDEGIL